MFLKSQRSYTRDGQQRAQGTFLMLFTTGNQFNQETEVRACVRSVRLEQCGHFMMGSVTLKGVRVVLSGTYGSDGLTMQADEVPGLWDTLVPLPADLRVAFWKSDSGNSAGSEGPAIHQWAQDNINQLRRAGL